MDNININNIILTPDGYAVDLNSIRAVTPVESGVDRCEFELKYKGLDKSMYFQFFYSDYSETRDELLVKVQNVRREIVKMVNHGVEPRTVLGNINLKKDGPVSKAHGQGSDGWAI
jgi:hypothetical protein